MLNIGKNSCEEMQEIIDEMQKKLKKTIKISKIETFKNEYFY